MNNEGYKYTFTEALEKCMFEDYFIRGIKFDNGYYIKKIDNTLYVVSSYFLTNAKYTMIITNSIMTQKFKVFSVANKQALNLE